MKPQTRRTVTIDELNAQVAADRENDSEGGGLDPVREQRERERRKDGPLRALPRSATRGRSRKGGDHG